MVRFLSLPSATGKWPMVAKHMEFYLMIFPCLLGISPISLWISPIFGINAQLSLFFCQSFMVQL